MRRTYCNPALLLIGLAILALGGRVQAVIVYEITSPYHHIRVIDQQGLRTLSFDNSRETRMSLLNPLQGHFEYTEFFHLPWLWQPEMTNVLMIGLGGGSTQRAYQFFYPQVMGLSATGTDTRAGQTARLYVGGISKWEIDFFPKAPVPEPEPDPEL